MLNTNIKEIPNRIRISLSSMKKSYLKNIRERLSAKLCDSSPITYFEYITIKS